MLYTVGSMDGPICCYPTAGFEFWDKYGIPKQCGDEHTQPRA